MKNLFLLLLFFPTSLVFAQTKTDSVLFSTKSDIADFQFSKKDNFSFEYLKYLNSTIPFSIYNPKPGFNPTKMERQKYYSFTSTNLLVRRQMSAIEPQPIYPEQQKNKTIKDAIFEGIINEIFSKK